MNDVYSWLNSHSLKLNTAKSEFLLFGSKTQLAKIDINSISFSGMSINVSQTCRNLGVMLDCNMTMSHQVSSICRSVRYQLRNIGFIRKYLNRSSTEKLVYALISSRLDFGNSYLTYHKLSSPCYRGFKMRQHASLHCPRSTLTSPRF